MKQTILVFTCMMMTGFYAYAQVEKFANSITPADLKNHLFKIASPEMQGRETATEGQRTAASYIEEQFKKDQLTPGWKGTYQQPFPVYRDSLVKAVLIINGKELIKDTDFAPTLNSGFNISLESNEILFAGFGQSDSSRDDYKNLNARGKIVVIWKKFFVFLYFFIHRQKFVKPKSKQNQNQENQNQKKPKPKPK